MKHLNNHRIGVAVGVFAVVVHALWALMVLLGLGQWWMDWMTGLHMSGQMMTVGMFSWGTVITLLIVAYFVGYILGWLFAWSYNYAHKKK
jgi:hypothetical protein